MPYKLSDKNREYQRNHIKQRRRKRHKELLEGKVCERCGFDDFRALEFHHTNPEEKEFTIGRILAGKMNVLLEEIKKCELLCANCHRIEHSMHND